jgi:hypothetical protein
MNIEVLGEPIIVPNRYPNYSDEQKDAIVQHVRLLQKVWGDRLGRVHVDRLVKRGDQFRVVGTFSYGSASCGECGKGIGHMLTCSQHPDGQQLISPPSDLIARAKAALEGVTLGPWVIPLDETDAYDVPVIDSAGRYICHSPDDGVRGGFNRPDAEFVAAARTLVPALVSEIERLREGLVRIENFSRLQALSDRVRTGPAAAGYHSEERYWLDLLAIIERVQGGAS